jgi:hypothetical protein
MYRRGATAGKHFLPYGATRQSTCVATPSHTRPRARPCGMCVVSFVSRSRPERRPRPAKLPHKRTFGFRSTAVACRGSGRRGDLAAGSALATSTPGVPDDRHSIRTTDQMPARRHRVTSSAGSADTPARPIPTAPSRSPALQEVAHALCAAVAEVHAEREHVGDAGTRSPQRHVAGSHLDSCVQPGRTDSRP